MIFGIISVAVHIVLGAGLGAAAGGTIGLLVGAVAGLLIGAPFGWAVASAGTYAADAKGIVLFVVDHTWSLLNTLAGALYLTLHLVFGHQLDRAVSQASGRVNLVEGVSPRYATTIGTVCAGSSPGIQRHEDVHVLQARLLGPLYLPLVALNFALFTIAPVWLLWHDHSNAPINRFTRYFEIGVYPHVWNEAIAYRVQGTPPR
ncbi:glycine zipper family protein [Micromonospora terminaliae]|uniref:Glycine zipper family protein n=1 Tax=Micromonospora terminaliae TaxID=1914461 RepID=A0AAJ2ZCU0_9ACTN|nr:glycine zipper family protein [Micromonospora terminaliae]NES27261.1 glycine zipper family protein [Micromonospora terminaliae]QGL47987.1 glycine zipper family protein [Micromonospora terminaliae]